MQSIIELNGTGLLVRGGLALAVLLVGVTFAFGQDGDGDAGQADGAVAPLAFNLSEPIIKEVKPQRTFVYAETEARFDRIMEGIGATFGRIMATVGGAGLQLDGDVLFTYTLASKDAGDDEPFTLRCGYVLSEVPDAFAEFDTEPMQPMKCVSYYYTGPYSHLPAAWMQVSTAVQMAGHETTGHSREFYLYHETAESPNNVVELQVGIE